jgi:hypothetical protein
MKKFLVLLIILTLMLGTMGLASAALYREAYSGSQIVYEGEVYNFGFDFFLQNDLSGTVTDSALVVYDDAEGLKPTYIWDSALLVVKLYSKDVPTETAGFELDLLDSIGSVVHTFDFGEVLFDLQKPDNKTVTYLYELTQPQLDVITPSFSSWVNARITAEEGDFEIKKVGMDVHASPTPEPATLLLMGSGLLGVAGIGRKRIGKKVT